MLMYITNKDEATFNDKIYAMDLTYANLGPQTLNRFVLQYFCSCTI